MLRSGNRVEFWTKDVLIEIVTVSTDFFTWLVNFEIHNALYAHHLLLISGFDRKSAAYWAGMFVLHNMLVEFGLESLTSGSAGGSEAPLRFSKLDRLGHC